MTYGVYSPDLKTVSVTDMDLETARKYRYGDNVICTERWKTYGFEVSFAVVNYWEFRFWRHLGEARVGFLQIKWRRKRYRTADKIVEGSRSET